MKDLGILMTPGNVVAIDEDRKTMTRRLVNPQPQIASHRKGRWFESRGIWRNTQAFPGQGWKAPCAAGQHLYIKETMHCVREISTGGIYFDTYYAADKAHVLFDGPPRNAQNGFGHGLYGEYDDWLMGYRDWWKAGKDKQVIPAIHMPKKFARRWLEVTKVHAPERGKDISEEDAIAEGVDSYYHNEEGRMYLNYQTGMYGLVDARGSFYSLLQSIYGPDALLRWYWPIEFKKIKKE